MRIRTLTGIVTLGILITAAPLPAQPPRPQGPVQQTPPPGQYGYVPTPYQPSTFQQMLSPQQQSVTTQQPISASPITVLRPAGQTPGAAQDFSSVRLDFQVMSFEAPEGWDAYLALGDTSVGAFGIILHDPNGRMQVRFAHNWHILFDRQVGGYLAGNAVLEHCLLPQLAQEIAPYVYEGVLSRSENTRTLFSDPALASFGVQIPSDAGSLVFAVRHPQGERLIGNAYCNTLRIVDLPDNVFGRNDGVFSVQFALLTVAPGEEAAQRFVMRILENLIATLQPSEEYMERWREGARQSAHMSAEYSESVDGLISSGQVEASGSNAEMSDQWVAYMRGGQYAEDPVTGQNHWVTNDYSHWFVDPQGHVVGSNTGDPPSYDREWRRLRPGG
ncbi:hypothetical protein JXA47_10430 [Candidatus Sumerlaeota bacterium]|nr:hypothetical protein [Candidatus Sumerlaeota bacterium]